MLGMRPRYQLGSSSGQRLLAHQLSPCRSGEERDQCGDHLHASSSGMGFELSQHVPRTCHGSPLGHYIYRSS